MELKKTEGYPEFPTSHLDNSPRCWYYSAGQSLTKSQRSGRTGVDDGDIT